MNDALRELMKPEIEEEIKTNVEKERIDNIITLISNGASMDVLYKSFGKSDVDKAQGKMKK